MLCILLTGCGQEHEDTVIEKPSKPPISEQAEEYELLDVTIKSAGGYTGYVSVSSTEVDVHPYFDLDEHLAIRIIYTSDTDWWNTATIGLEKYTSDTYELVQRADGLVFGFMPVDSTYGIFVTTETLSLDYVKLYMDKIWISDT